MIKPYHIPQQLSSIVQTTTQASLLISTNDSTIYRKEHRIGGLASRSDHSHAYKVPNAACCRRVLSCRKGYRNDGRVRQERCCIADRRT